MYRRLSQLLLFSFLLSTILTGCSVVALGVVIVAATTGEVVATDPRNSGTVMDDMSIQNKLMSVYSTYHNSNIYVNSYNGSVLLSGQVLNAKTKESAEFEAKAMPGVKQIYDYISIRLPQSLASISTDSYTTTQVRSKLVGIDNVKSNDIKVVTTDDVVYLFGIVTPAQATAVAKAAASVGGVKKVVTLFEYLSIK